MKTNDNKVFYGLCYVVADKPEDSYDIDVMLVSLIPDTKGALTGNNSSNLNMVDSKGQHTAIAANSSNNITATWLPDGEQNRISAPDVCKGDIVEVYSINGTDEYYWKVYAHNVALRKREKVLYWFSNKAGTGGSETDAYFLLVDTRNKNIHLHTANNDGEACSYDVMLDTRAGVLMIKDSLNNSLELDSVGGVLDTKINNKIVSTTLEHEINCKTMVINASESFTLNTKKHNINSSVSKTN